MRNSWSNSSAAARTQTSRISTGRQFSFDTLHCEFAVVLVQFSGTSAQDTLHQDPTDRSLICEGTSSRRCSPSQLRAWGTKHHLRGSLHPDLNVERDVPAVQRKRDRSIPSIRSASHLSDSGILLTFAARVLIADPCSVTTTASDDGFSNPTKTPRWNRGVQNRCVPHSSMQSV